MLFPFQFTGMVFYGKHTILMSHVVSVLGVGGRRGHGGPVLHDLLPGGHHAQLRPRHHGLLLPAKKKFWNLFF